MTKPNINNLEKHWEEWQYHVAKDMDDYFKHRKGMKHWAQ